MLGSCSGRRCLRRVEKINFKPLKYFLSCQEVNFLQLNLHLCFERERINNSNQAQENSKAFYTNPGKGIRGWRGRSEWVSGR